MRAALRKLSAAQRDVERAADKLLRDAAARAGLVYHGIGDATGDFMDSLGRGGGE